MPLEFSDWSWTQSESTVHIRLPVRGAAAGRVDIMSTEQYLKVHHPPYLFEAFLFQPVDDAASRASVTHTCVDISLSKKTSGLWKDLVSAAGDAEKKRLRELSLLSYQDKLSSESSSRAQSRLADSRYALKTMMKMEEKQRDRIKEIKDSERDKMAAELRAWEQEKAGTRPRNARKLEKRGANQRAPCPDERSSSLELLPPPRPSGNIRLTFTPRVFPTALRESRVKEEEEWLRRQAEGRLVAADAAELQDLPEPQRNPDWLKDKGDNCFLRGDYLGAVGAYSLALRLSPRVPALFSNRAACHLKLRNLHKAVEDASKALELLTPPVEANAAARTRAHARRGSALCQLQLHAEGLLDYQAAVKITPTDAALQADMDTIRDIVQGRVDKAVPTQLD